MEAVILKAVGGGGKGKEGAKEHLPDAQESSKSWGHQGLREDP